MIGCRVGDRVTVAHDKWPGVWIVEKVNAVTVMLEPEGGGRRLRVPHSLLRDPDAAPEPLRFYHPGEFVRVAEGRFAGLYVVLKDDGGDKVNLARLGGDQGRYVRTVRSVVQPVDTTEVLK